MDISRSPLIISYAGSLSGFQPDIITKRKNSWFQFPYKVNNINHHTRCGYYFFKGIERLVSKYEITPRDLQIHFWGDIDKLNVRQVDDMKLSQFLVFEGYLSKEKTVENINNSDVLFLPLESSKDEQKPLFVPGKLYEYFKSKKPIFALAEESDVLEFLTKSKSGICCSPFDSEAIADKLFFLIQNKNSLSQLYEPNITYIESFSFVEKTKELATIFDKL